MITFYLIHNISRFT